MRELAQRGVLDGERGGYVCRADVADVNVPATVQAHHRQHALTGSTRPPSAR